MSSLLDQFYLYQQKGPDDTWGRYLERTDPLPSLSDVEKERFSRDLELLEAAESALLDPTSGVDSSAFDRNAQWLSRKNAHLEQLRAEVAANEAQNCTFRPQIDSKSVRMTSRHSDVGTRLHELHVRSLSERRARKDEQQQVEEAALTFRPKIVRSEWTESVQPRYLDPRDNNDGSDHRRKRAGAADYLSETCTFQPVVNHNKSSEEAIARYLTLPVHERLVRRHALQEEARRKSAHDESGAASRRLSKEELEAFVERTRQAEEARRSKLTRLALNEAEASTPRQFRYASASAPKVEGDILSRNAAMQRRIEERRQHQPPADKDCTFTPKITKIATHKKRAPGALFHTHRAHHEQLRVENEKRLLDAQQRECTFRPHLSPAARRARGKIVSALHSAETFDVFVKSQRNIRETDARQWREQLDDEVNKECTFAPATHPVPPAVRAISDSLRAASQQSSLRREHGDDEVQPFRF